MDLGEHFACRDRVAALLEAADTDGVVDVLVLGAPPRTEPERGHADGDCADRADEAVCLRRDLAHDRCRRQGALGRVSALRGDPAFVHRERRSVLDRGCGPLPPGVLVEPEVGEREEMGTG